MMPEIVAKQYWSRGGITPQIREEIEKILASNGHDDSMTCPHLSAYPSGSEAPDESSKPVTSQSKLEKLRANAAKARAAKAAKKLKTFHAGMGDQISHLVKNGNLDYHLGEVAKHFKSPLAKGRIFRKLKAFPVIK